MPFLIVIPIILIVLFVAYLKRPESKGKRGENAVKRILGKTVQSQQYVINDLIIANGDKSCQIDHIVINPRGVFVIETKNYSGQIYGNEDQREWTQVLAGGKVTNKLYNPLKQNATHVYNVKKVVGNLPVHSLVVFVQNNTYNVQSNNVIATYQLKSALNQGESVLTAQQMQTAYQQLLSTNTVSAQQHLRNVKQQQKDLERGICPRCGGTLVLRTSDYGVFWGCSNYPKCKFTKN